MSAQTEIMTARTSTHVHRQLAPATLAARSLLAVDRLASGSPEQAEAFSRHMRTYGTPIRRICKQR